MPRIDVLVEFYAGLSCLMRIKDAGGSKLDPKCTEMLNTRTQLFANVAKV